MSAVSYRTSVEGLRRDQLDGFFVDWPNPPSTATHLRLLESSYRVVLAIADDRVIGFVSAISDGVLSAYVPLLEVLPDHHGSGIGTELVSRMLDELAHLYMVDVLCDADVAPFYDRFPALQRAGAGFLARNYAAQSGS